MGRETPEGTRATRKGRRCPWCTRRKTQGKKGGEHESRSNHEGEEAEAARRRPEGAPGTSHIPNTRGKLRMAVPSYIPL